MLFQTHEIKGSYATQHRCAASNSNQMNKTVKETGEENHSIK